MITMYVIIKLMSGVVPKHILQKHVVSMKRFAAMHMNAEEFVQSSGLLIAGVCALFMLGNYGTEGGFRNDTEKFFMFVVMGTGFACLIMTAAWKMVAIRGEMKRGEDSEQLHQGESSSSTSEVMLTEASSFWFYLGVLVTTLQTMLYVLEVVTINGRYLTIAIAGVPTVMLIYLLSFCCQPKRHSRKDMMMLRLHFAR